METQRRASRHVSSDVLSFSLLASSVNFASAHGAVVARYLHAASGQLRSRLQVIGALVPPSSLASQVNQFVALLNRYADGLDGLANRAQSGDTYAALIDRSTSQVNSLNSLSDQADRIASKLGFTACET